MLAERQVHEFYGRLENRDMFPWYGDADDLYHPATLVVQKNPPAEWACAQIPCGEGLVDYGHSRRVRPVGRKESAPLEHADAEGFEIVIIHRIGDHDGAADSTRELIALRDHRLDHESGRHGQRESERGR